MLENATEGIDRRTFVKQAAGAMLAAGMSAKSYARVLGANDRIRLGQLGCGDRSEGHVHMVQLAAKQMPVETVAVCDHLEPGAGAPGRPGEARVQPGTAEL